MILQIISSGHDANVQAGGGSYWDTPGPTKDDGVLGENYGLGYPINSPALGSGWTMSPYFSSGLITTSDAPAYVAPMTAYSMSSSNSFQTYLMYQPPMGVWVALSETDWSYSLSVRNNPWPADFSRPAPVPQDSTPSGAAAFPRLGDQFFFNRGYASLNY